MVAELREQYPAFKSPFDFEPLSMYGMKIIEEPKLPQKIKLSNDVMVSDEFRVDFNTWLLERFGRKKPFLEDGMFMVSRDYGITVGNSKSVMMLNTMA